MTSSDPDPLPSFAAPPVQHVSFVLLLDPVPLRTVHVGLLWTEMLREKYPDVQDGPNLFNQLEQFSEDPRLPQFQFQVITGAPSPQVIFQSRSAGISLSVQNDRLSHAWERATPDADYPRYPSLRASFRDDAATFARFCEQNGIGEIALRQIEVNYVNVLTSGQGWDRPGELHRVLQPWSPDFASNLGEPEDVRIAQRYLVTRDGEPYARLHIAIEPHRTPDGSSTMRMALTFRGEPQEYTLDGMMAFVDEGHDRIVRAFTAATTPEMHEVWGRER